MFSGAGNLTNISRFQFLAWFCLAFESGFINVGGFLACNRYVTHITGSLTRFAVEISLGHAPLALGALAVPAAFFIGALVSAVLVDRRILKAQRPQFHLIFFALSSLLFFISFFGALGFFGIFGEHLNYSDEFALILLLAFGIGLQNAAVSSATHSLVRTSHMTGMLTDFGVTLIRLIFGTNGDTGFHPQRERTIFKLRFGLLTSFSLGGLIGSVVFSKIQFFGFIFPAIIAFGFFVYVQTKVKTHA